MAFGDQFVGAKYRIFSQPLIPIAVSAQNPRESVRRSDPNGTMADIFAIDMRPTSPRKLSGIFSVVKTFAKIIIERK